MKKKKQNHSSNNAESVTAAENGFDDLESLIHLNAEFFDHLVELIPSKFYLPIDDAESKPWYQGLGKVAKASLKQQTRQNLKLARRQRFNPDKEEPQKHENVDEVEEITLAEASNPSVTYEELREKLRKKIDLLKGNRGEKQTYEKKMKKDVRKLKSDTESNSNCTGIQQDGNKEQEMEYGKVKLDDENEGSRINKRKKLSKEKELQNAKRLKETKKDNPQIGDSESWKAATNRAGGVKVHDNPRLIKESMKREKRKKEKSAEKWKVRVETQDKFKKEKQDKRRQNIALRINDKKMRKIAKREKKLLRPGFEGRKEGYITNE